MTELVARTGRHQQRYEGGYRLIAGCIPFRYRNMKEDVDDTTGKIVEVLMINSTSGPGLLFPKVECSNPVRFGHRLATDTAPARSGRVLVAWLCGRGNGLGADTVFDLVAVKISGEMDRSGRPSRLVGDLTCFQ
ncbi:hypothetical protein OROGR_013831 [Orobanche gracilis]